MTYSVTTEVVATPRHLSAEVGDDVMVLDLDAGIYFGIEGAGQVVWRMLQNPTLISAIVDGVVAEFDVDRDKAQADIIAFIEALTVSGLVEVRESGDPSRK
jgi:hypothetical protein